MFQSYSFDLFDYGYGIVPPEEDGIAELPAQIHIQGDQKLLGGTAQL
jgi:hypothetical protein